MISAVSAVEARARRSDGGKPQQQAADLFANIEKALRVRRLYSVDGKLYREAQEALAERFAAYLEEAGELTVTVTAEAIIAGDQKHLASLNHQASIPFKLFRDGIRSLRFVQGLTADELRRFLAALEQPPELPGQIEDDMVTILWRESFLHIEVMAVDEIGGLQGSAGAGGGNQLSDKLRGGIDEILRTLQKPFVDQPIRNEGKQIPADQVELFEVDRQGKSSASMAGEDIFGLPDAVVTRLLSECREDEGLGLVRRAFAIISEMCRAGECALVPGESHELLWRFLQEMLTNGDLEGVTDVLESMIALEAERSSPGGKDMLETLLSRLGSEKGMDFLLAAAKRDKPPDAQLFFRVLLRLPVAALQICARQLRSLPAGPVKDAYHRVLRSRGHEDPMVLVAYLEEEGGKFAVAALRSILAERKIPGVTVALARTLSHELERVRINAVRVCAALTGHARRVFLRTGLSDTSPEVRNAALHAMEASGDREFVGVLRGHFDTCQAERERIRVVRAMGGLGGAEAKAWLELIFRPRSLWKRWFRRGVANPRWIRAAILSLGDARDPQVLTFLSEKSHSGDPYLAAACRDALKKAKRQEAVSA